KDNEKEEGINSENTDYFYGNNGGTESEQGSEVVEKTVKKGKIDEKRLENGSEEYSKADYKKDEESLTDQKHQELLGIQNEVKKPKPKNTSTEIELGF